MKTNAFLVSALVLASGSVAMADSSFTVKARAQLNVRFGNPLPVVRDHRSHQAPQPAPLPRWRTVDFDRNYEELQYAAPLPAVTGPTWNCQNWDPSIELSSVCAAYASSNPEPLQAYRGLTAFGVRDSAVPDHQFITVGPGKSFRKIVIEGNDGSPQISKVAIRFMDGTTQVVNTNIRLREGRSIDLFLDGGNREINQMVFYTPTGSTGSYSVLGL